MRRTFLDTIAERTGGRTVVQMDALAGNLEIELDRVLDETGSYYLIGYESSNTKRDGRFRRLEVKTDYPGVTVRSRSGYYATQDGSVLSGAPNAAPRPYDLTVTGLAAPATLALRATGVALAPVGATSPDVNVAIVVAVRLPELRQPILETLTFVRTIYDAEGRAGPLVREVVQPASIPNAADNFRYELRQLVTLVPGRYQIRFHVTSGLFGTSGSVYADLEVPHFARRGLSVSGIMLGPIALSTDRRDALSGLMSVVLTSKRDFASDDDLAALVHIFQTGADRSSPVTATAKVLDRADNLEFETERILSPEKAHAVPFETPLPLGRLKPGPHLLTISVVSPGEPPIRRDLRFNVR
jgi:hypothetical protein